MQNIKSNGCESASWLAAIQPGLPAVLSSLAEWPDQRRLRHPHPRHPPSLHLCPPPSQASPSTTMAAVSCCACQESQSWLDPLANDFILAHRLTTTSSGPYMRPNQVKSPLHMYRSLRDHQTLYTLTRTCPRHQKDFALNLPHLKAHLARDSSLASPRIPSRRIKTRSPSTSPPLLSSSGVTAAATSAATAA